MPVPIHAQNYLPYYERTVAAVLRADSKARVGGPALADPRSPILPALLEACDRRGLPLNFVSWHIYDSEPLHIRGTIDLVRGLIGQHPSLAPETILNEWNMSLGHVPEDVRIQPCFVLETAFHMQEAGLDYACYYHIRDAHVSEQEIGRFMSPKGTAFMTNWWNRYPQFHGLFDFQNVVRPAYFAFKLLARLTGERVQVESSDAQVHAFAAYEASLEMHNLLFWNFSSSPAQLSVELTGSRSPLRARQLSLDAATASADENARLRPEGTLDVEQGTPHHVRLAPTGLRSGSSWRGIVDRSRITRLGRADSLFWAAGCARRERHVHHFPRAVLTDEIEVIDPAIGDFSADTYDKRRPYHRDVIVHLDRRIRDALLKRPLRLYTVGKLRPALLAKVGRAVPVRARRRHAPVRIHLTQHRSRITSFKGGEQGFDRRKHRLGVILSAQWPLRCDCALRSGRMWKK